jgi:hypothetical protein
MQDLGQMKRNILGLSSVRGRYVFTKGLNMILLIHLERELLALEFIDEDEKWIDKPDHFKNSPKF